MIRALLRLFTGWCYFHDRPAPLKIAEMEEAAGINPHAVAHLRSTADMIESYYDPDLIDCRNSRCRRRRGLPA
jgi:hypothetical protein